MVQISGQIIWIPVIGLALFTAFKKFARKDFFFFCFFIFLAIIAADTTSSQILKNIFGRLRPCRQDDLMNLIQQFGQRCGGRFGFVSSHASNTFAATVFIIESLQLSRQTKIVALFFPLLVSYSRIYLGVHFPGDILGGALVGILWGLGFAWAFRHLQGAKRESFQESPSLE